MPLSPVDDTPPSISLPSSAPLAPATSRWPAWARLMRLPHPMGLLLLWPCWWAIALASPYRFPDIGLLCVFACGAVVMRGVGCIINDLTDQTIDQAVTRTCTRPLASGEMTRKEALAWLGVLLIIALGLLWMLPVPTRWLGLGVMPGVILYPWMKRITHWPQLVLGLVYNWGAVMGWSAAQGGTLSVTTWIIYAACVAWTLGYDTLYAHQDAADDAAIGVKSTALLWKEKLPFFVGNCYKAVCVFLLLAGLMEQQSSLYYGVILLCGLQLYWQVEQWDANRPEHSGRLFRSNSYFGAMVFASIVIGNVMGQ